jgi:predicted transcriptional regulator
MELIPYQEIVSKLRKKRKKNDLQQQMLADLLDISPSKLSLIEKNRREADYTTIYNIWKKLEEIEEDSEEQETARDLMSTPITYLCVNDTAEKASKVMRKNDFSQLPVKRDQQIVGSIKDKDLMDVGDPDKKIKEIMSEKFPTVYPETSRRPIKELLKESSGLIVKTRKGNPKGIIAKFDLL